MTIKFKQDPLSDVVIWGVRKLLTCLKDASLSIKLANVANTDRRYTITATIQAMTRAIWKRETRNQSLWSLSLPCDPSETYYSLHLIMLRSAPLTWEADQASLSHIDGRERTLARQKVSREDKTCSCSWVNLKRLSSHCSSIICQALEN